MVDGRLDAAASASLRGHPVEDWPTGRGLSDLGATVILDGVVERQARQLVVGKPPIDVVR